MRTTLTIDDDVAAALKRVKRKRKAPLKAIVNEALRSGLKEMTMPPKRSSTYRTRVVSLGRCLVGSIDDVSEVLALTEGEDFK
ncbi:MAG: DUF2191 domain-containing protein [Thermodesulfobacteriota bacterium]|nr:DUF2191 domain-containing protein [Thermodesulfobacteriota bacterium]